MAVQQVFKDANVSKQAKQNELVCLIFIYDLGLEFS
jgi:hypothetical protein